VRRDVKIPLLLALLFCKITTACLIDRNKLGKAHCRDEDEILSSNIHIIHGKECKPIYHLVVDGFSASNLEGPVL